MAEAKDLRNLEDVLRQMECAGTDEIVCVEHVLEAIGPRSFGALLLAPSVIVVSPISGIPGIPTVAGVIIALIAIQILIGREAIWLPRRLGRRCIDRRRLEQAVKLLRPVARIADRILRPRLNFLMRTWVVRLIAATCLAIAALFPPLEIVPFATSIFATAISVFGLALVANDGLLVIVAFTITGAAAYIGANAFL